MGKRPGQFEASLQEEDGGEQETVAAGNEDNDVEEKTKR